MSRTRPGCVPAPTLSRMGPVSYKECAAAA
jgi:hypothetical protein